MGLFSKKLSAKDIIEALGALSDEEREQVKAFAFGNDAVQTEDLPDASDEAQAAENDASPRAPVEEAAEEVPAEEPSVDEEVSQESEEQTADPGEASKNEEVPSPVGEASAPAEPVAEQPEEQSVENAGQDISAILARMEKLEETVLALANRIGAQEDKADEDNDDPFGYAFGPEHKSESTESDLEKAKREAGFNF